MQKPKLLLLFPDGVGIRNYLYSDVFRGISEDLVLFHNFDPETIASLKAEVALSQTILIPDYKESAKEKFLRELICLSRLFYNAEKVGNTSLLSNWNWYQNTLSKKMFYKAIEKIAPFFKTYSTILKLEEHYQKAIRKNPFYKEVKVVLELLQPKCIFCSHQRGLKAATIFAAASDLGIPSTTVIYSWDNLPKARMALRADHYLVWSDHMKKEMDLYYPEISSEAIHITGTPQFEFYQDEQNVIEKQLFYQKYNLDPARKIICFSGDDTKTSPDDPAYLEDLAEEICKANLQESYQILVRRCPVDFSGRFDAVVKKYSHIIREVPPLWYFNTSEQWTTIYPSMADVQLLVSTAFYADLVINVGSTMAFDFAMFDKPCIFINYDQENKSVADWSVKTIYEFQHFKSMPGNDAVIWLNNKEEIVDKIVNNSRYLSGESMREWFYIIVGQNTASINIASALGLTKE